jgi:hypothetical protein
MLHAGGLLFSEHRKPVLARTIFCFDLARRAAEVVNILFICQIIIKIKTYENLSPNFKI